MEFIPKSDYKIVAGQWNGYTLILPCVSVANVPQLTVDLLVNENVQVNNKPGKDKDLVLVGSLWSENVYPYAGVDPYCMGGSNNATSIQVFVSESKKLVIIQQRSPVYKERREEFYTELSSFLSGQQFSSILILSSSFDQFLMPELHNASEVPIKYLGSNLNDSIRDYLAKNSKRIQSVSPVDPETMIPKDDGKIYLPGSGSTRGFMKMFTKTMPKTPVLCLILFCSEGENQVHAMVFADVVADLLNREKAILPVRKQEKEFAISKYSWEHPWSWRRMFGNEAPISLF